MASSAQERSEASRVYALQMAGEQLRYRRMLKYIDR